MNNLDLQRFLQIYNLDDVINVNTIPKGFMSDYITFMKDTALKKTSQFHVPGFNLFLVVTAELNARAIGQSIICLHMSLLIHFENHIHSYLKNSRVKLLEQMRANSEMPTPEYLFLEFICSFIYFHELGHLNQNIKANEIEVFSEKINLIRGADYKPLSHAKEIDADIFAAQTTIRNILPYWQKLPIEQQTKESLEELISTACATIILFFYCLNEGWVEFYPFEHEHPHDIIRVNYIVRGMTEIACEIASGDKSPSQETCFENSFSIAGDFLQKNNGNGMSDYFQMWKANKKKIIKYGKVMESYMRQVPCLIQNWAKST